MAPADMRPGTAKVGEDVGVVAASVFESVGEDGEPLWVERAGGQEPLLVGGGREGRDGGRSPSRVEGDGAEGVADNVAEQGRLLLSLGRRGIG